MTAFDDGFGGYLALLMIAALAHEPWRWLGLFVGGKINPDGEIFRWVSAVSTALVAGLVGRLLFFPTGELQSVSGTVRVVAFAIAIGAFFLANRSLLVGVLVGALTLVGGHWVIN